MLSFFKDFRWDKLKFDFTKFLGRTYYFNFALFWWVLDLIVFLLIGIEWQLLIVVIPLVYFTATTTLKWLSTLVFSTLCIVTKNNLEIMLDRGNAFEGVPGSGKTSSINQFGLILAKLQWYKLRFEYWLISHLKFELLSPKLKRKYYEVIKAYHYYKRHEETHIPCLHCFITVEDRHGRKSYRFTKNHLLQKVAIPYRSVWICDEISSMFPNKAKGEETKLIDEMMRWIRHFTDSYALFADIRFNDTFLAIRKCCGCRMQLIQKQKWLLKPRFLIAIKKSVEALIDLNFWIQAYSKKGSKTYNKATYNLKKQASVYAPFMRWLNKLIYCVGYRQYTYAKTGSEEQGGNSKAQEVLSKGRYYLTSCLDIKYDERAFKELYSCKDKEFEEPVSMDISMSEEELKKMLGRTK